MDVLRDVQLDPWVLKDVLIIMVIEAPRPASRLQAEAVLALQALCRVLSVLSLVTVS